VAQWIDRNLRVILDLVVVFLTLVTSWLTKTSHSTTYGHRRVSNHRKLWRNGFLYSDMTNELLKKEKTSRPCLNLAMLYNLNIAMPSPSTAESKKDNSVIRDMP
jgi:hypothetical protein